MGEIINLNRARKARKKASDRNTAASNRVLHGLTKAERDASRADTDRAARRVDGHRVEARASVETPDPSDSGLSE